ARHGVGRKSETDERQLGAEWNGLIEFVWCDLTRLGKIRTDLVVHGANALHLTVSESNRTLTEQLHRGEIVAHKEHRAALARHVAHLANALLLKGDVADREYLVDEENRWFEMRRHGEAQPHLHTARVVLDRRV